MQLEEHPFVQSVPAEERPSLLASTETLELPRGATLFEEGDAADSMFLILQGRVNFIKNKPDGSEQSVSEAGEGQFFGELGVLTKEKRALTARADEDAVVARLPAKTMRSILASASQPVYRILDGLIQHLEATTRHYMTDVLRNEKLAVVGTMMASVLHDFKNPFSLISMATHMLRQRHADDARTLELCGSIDGQVRRMVDMANDITAFARGEEQLDPVDVRLPELIEAFRQEDAPLLENDAANIRFETDDCAIRADRGKLLRVLENLVSNAIEAIRENNGEAGEVVVRAKDQDDHVLVEVADNGPGIPESIRANFFEPFTTEGKSNGLGLGAAIVRSIVHAHGGAIDFDASEAGTRFAIRLPRAPRDDAARPEPGAAAGAI